MQPYVLPVRSSNWYRGRLPRKYTVSARCARYKELRQQLEDDPEDVVENPDLRLVDFAEVLEEFHVAASNGDVDRAQETLEKLRNILKCEPTAAVVDEWLGRVRLALVCTSQAPATAQHIARTGIER